MDRSTWGKAFGLGLVAVGLMAALSRIDWLVQERQQRQHAAQQEVAEATASPQSLVGPYLQRQCTEEWTELERTEVAGVPRETRRRVEAKRQLRATPAQLKIDGDLKPQLLERGLFKVNTYQAQLHLNASWNDLKALELESKKLEASVRCEPVHMLLEVSDARGLRSVQLLLDGKALSARPGSGGEAAGLHAVLPERKLDEALQLQATLELLGTESLYLLPAAHQVQASLRSVWPHPSFQGRFLPNDRTVTENGFSASWRVSELASSAAAQLRSGKQGNDWLGVALIDPVNPYSLSDRAVKYGFLFISLTLASVLLVELLGRRRLHPMQYGFVGLAMALFFLLLLALSEHLAFGLSYALAAGASTLLLAHYAASLFGHWRGGLGFGAGVGLLYGVLYVLLNLEKASLLVGALLLFVLLAGAMRATRDLDWYRLTQRAAD